MPRQKTNDEELKYEEMVEGVIKKSKCFYKEEWFLKISKYELQSNPIIDVLNIF